MGVGCCIGGAAPGARICRGGCCVGAAAAGLGAWALGAAWATGAAGLTACCWVAAALGAAGLGPAAAGAAPAGGASATLATTCEVASSAALAAVSTAFSAALAASLATLVAALTALLAKLFKAPKPKGILDSFQLCTQLLQLGFSDLWRPADRKAVAVFGSSSKVSSHSNHQFSISDDDQTTTFFVHETLS